MRERSGQMRHPAGNVFSCLWGLAAVMAAAVMVAAWHGSAGSVWAEQPQGVSEPSSLLIKANTIHVGNGQVLQPGMVWVEAGKIKAIGQSLEVPAEVAVRQVDVLIPGLVDAAAGVGVAGGAAEVTDEVTPEFEVGQAIDLLDRGFRQQMDAGVTTVHVVPDTQSVVAGFTCVVKTAGESEQRWIARQGGLMLAMCNDPTSGNSSRSRPDSLYVRQPTNRMGVVWILRSRFHAALRSQSAEAFEDSEAGNGGTARSAADVSLADLVSGKFPAYTVSRTGHDIETLLRISDEFSFQPILVGGDEAYKVLDVLAQREVDVIFTALSTGMTGTERTELNWNTPARMAESGIGFALAGDRLLEQASFAVRFGVDPQQALAAITSQPARILGLQDRIGSLEVGRDADMVALRGEPWQVTSAIQWVMIDGQIHSTDEDDDRHE